MRIWRSLHPSISSSKSAELRRSRRRRAQRQANSPRRELLLERFEDRLMMAGPQLVSIIPNDGEVLLANDPRDTLDVSPRELTIRFDQGQVIDPTSLGGIRITRAGTDQALGADVLGVSDDVTITPGFLGIGARPNEVVFRFADTLPDDLYRITIVGSGAGALVNADAEAFINNAPNDANPLSLDYEQDFRLDLAPRVVAVIPQPLTRDVFGSLVQVKDQIEVYFEQRMQPLPLSPSSLDPKLFQLFFTQGTLDPIDDVGPVLPTGVSYDPASNKAVLTFGFELNALGTGAYRLRVGNDDAPLTPPVSQVVAVDPGDTWATSFDAGNLNAAGAAHQILSQSIDPQAFNPNLVFPGGLQDPGHRDVPVETHLRTDADAPDGQIATVYYNFPDVYGSLPGNPQLSSVITPEQRQRAREIFQLYGNYLGVQFVELNSDQLTPNVLGIVTGLVQVAGASLPANLPGVASGNLAIMNSGVFQLESQSQYGGEWFHTAMHEIGHILGLGHSYELPPLTVQGSGGESSTGGSSAEGVFPGDADILHGQYLYRRDSKDIDLYKFIVTTPGTFTAETIAERQADSSLLNSVLTLYNETNVIRLPATGAGPVGSAVADGHSFTLDDGIAPAVTFVFDNNGSVVETTTLKQIVFSASETSHDIAVRIATVINATAASNGLAVTATVEFDRVVLSGPVTLSAGPNAGGIRYSVERQVVARNDDYFSNDSFLNLDLGVGRYYVAVTSTGNTNFDPNVPDSGANGNTQGAYDLRMDFVPAAQASKSLVDFVAPAGTGLNRLGHDAPTILDGDNDGAAGGVMNFWFNVGETIYVDKLAAPGGDGSLGTPYGNLAEAILAASNRIVAPANGGAALDDGDTFIVNDGVHSPVTFEFDDSGVGDVALGNVPVPFSAGDSSEDVAFNIFNAIQNQALLPEGSPNKLSIQKLNGQDLPTAFTGGSVVDLEGSQFVDVKNTPALLASAKIVRVVGNTGPNNSLGVLSASLASLPLDGQTFQITAGTQTITFEFDNNTSVVQTTTLRRVTLPTSGSLAARALAIANNMAVAINASSLGAAPGGPAMVASVTSDARGSRVDLTAVGNIIINAQAAPTLVATSNAQAYLVGRDQFGNTLADGADLTVPQGVTLMVDAGAVIKLQGANVEVGLSTPNVDRSRSALQVLGAPGQSVMFTSYNDNSLGRQTDFPDQQADRGQWGGLVFHDATTNPLDLEQQGIFLNFVNQADIRYGGGQLNPLSPVFNPIHLDDARPTISNNTITNSANAAMSANPDSFEESRFSSGAFTLDYDRAGPDIHGNRLSMVQPGAVPTALSNSINGLFVRTRSVPSQEAERLNVSARWDDADIVYVLSDSLVVQGTPGGPTADTVGGPLTARTDARLVIDPRVVVKLFSARIEVQTGGSLLAEGDAGNEIIFTSGHDGRYGAGGTFDTDGDDRSIVPPPSVAAPGDWGGLYFGITSQGSLDHAVVAYAGGESPIEGTSNRFNAIEIRQANVRIANSRLELNGEGLAGGSRTGRGVNTAATVFVLGAQPTIVGNTFVNNLGSTIDINVNSLRAEFRGDLGRSTGPLGAYTQFEDNRGPLVRLNRIGNVSTNVGAINGMVVRGGTLTTESVWDDTDIVHVVRNEIIDSNEHSSGGIRLQSSPTESVVVKLGGPSAGITASGVLLDINDRIGGTVQLVGTPGHPVVLTALSDDTVGAGLTPDGQPQNDTDNTPGAGIGSGDGGPVFPPSGGELTVTTTTDAMTLVNGMLIRPLASGVTIDSATYTGGTDAAGTYINGDGVPLEIPQVGTIITTGDANLPTSNTSSGWSAIMGTAGDADLDALIAGTGNTTEEAAILTITFTVDPASGLRSGRFNFQFGSDEFSEFVGSPFNDVLGAFINGGPLTNFMRDSQGNLVSINSALFNIDNETTPFLDIEYDGMTSGLLAEFPVQPGLNTLKIAIGDVSDPALDSGILLTDLRFSQEDVGTGGVGQEVPELVSWRSVRLDPKSNDRNVAVVNEAEKRYTGGVNANGVPGPSGNAEPLGELAPDEKSGDDVRRLGFELHGFISPDEPGDVDVYRFSARGGTEVWLDIDKTSPALDTVVELLDANGTVVARSNDSVTETPASLAALLPGNLARVMQRDEFVAGTYASNSLRDYGTTNPRDAGLRVVLPGTISSTPNTYYVRVRSNGPNLNVVNGGQSRGAYQLQVRLRELDEAPGSVVAYSDIRFATNGLEILGLPGHSPLMGEAGESSLDTVGVDFDSAQDLGNLLASDRTAISIAGSMSSLTDVDWYSFTLNYDLVQAVGGINGGLKTFAAMFDVDYADALPARPDTVISVFDQDGNLVLISRDSNVTDDQPAPNAGNNLNDLSRGSVGKLDPNIGTVQLPAGLVTAGISRRYFVAVHSNATLPTAISATFQANAAQTLVRLEPIDSVKRVAEDHIGFSGGQTADTPRPLFGAPDGSDLSVQRLNVNAAPFTLANVTLFVNAGGNAGHLFAVNPFTGAQLADVGNVQDPAFGYNDIAMRNDGRLYGLSVGNTDGNSGNYNQISTGNATIVTAGDDGILTYEVDPANLAQNRSRNAGVQFEAMAFVQNGTTRRLFAVGSYVGGFQTPARSNLFYELNPDTGLALNLTGGLVTPTDPQPSFLDTGAGGGPSGTITGMAAVGGVLYAVCDQGGLYRVNVGSGNPNGASLTYIASSAGLNGLSFSGLSAGPANLQGGAFANMLFATTSNGRLYAFDTTGARQGIFAAGATDISLGVSGAVGLAFSTLDFNLWHVTDRRGADAGHGINQAFDNSRSNDPGLPFSSTNSNQPQQQGDQSFYFGFENRTDVYAQPDVANYATNAAIYGTYDMPGGAAGSLVTNPFSLANYTYGDKPTLYVNYFLQTQQAGGTTMLDSARILVSSNDGATWSLLATNNSAVDTELPRYITTSSQVGYSHGLGQRVQELFDDTDAADAIGWRQLRVDLGDFAGQGNLLMRFDFSTAGGMGTTGANILPGDQFDVIGTANASQRGQANNFEGFYIDDVIVGFAERGEMVTGPVTQTAQTTFFNVPRNQEQGAPTQNLAGPYQLEIRRATEYGANRNAVNPDISLSQAFDTNDRLAQAWTILAPAGAAVVDGQTFTISDGINTVTFEFNNAGGVTAGNVAVPFAVGDSAATVALSMRNVINSNALLNVEASTIDNNGVTTGALVQLFGAATVQDLNSPPLDLTVRLNAPLAIAENGGATTASVTREGSTAGAISVTVRAFDLVNGVRQPSSRVSLGGVGNTFVINIAAGSATSPSFAVTAIDNAIVDGTHTVVLEATFAGSPGFNPVSDRVDILDNESPVLTLAIAAPKTVAESAGPGAINATVTRNTPTTQALIVNIRSMDTSEATVPATVTIPAGFASVTFAVNAVDEVVIDGTQTVQIVAFASGFASGQDVLLVTDDVTDTVMFGTPAWTAQGPNAINGATNVENVSPNSPAVGAIRTVAAHDTNADILYVGTANGGIWRTTNATAVGGPTWTPLTDSQASLSIGALEFDPTDAARQTLIAGIGRFSSFNSDGGALTGLLRTTDGGANWTALNTPLQAPNLLGENISGVSARGNVLMAASDGAFGVGGLFRSTNFGGSFTAVSGTSGLPVGAITSLVGDPSNTDRFYVGVLSQGIFRSDDGGANWVLATPSGFTPAGPGQNIRIAVHANSGSGTNAVYAAFVQNGQLTNVFRSTTAGGSWTAMDLPQTIEGGVPVGIHPGGQGAIHFSLAADPNNVNLVYIGGDRQPTPLPNSLGATALSGRLFRGNAALPAGSQWTSITNAGTSGNSSPHSGSRSLAFNALGELLETDGGGIYRRSFPGSSFGNWFSMLGSLQISEFHSVAYDTNTNTLIAGAQDNGIGLQVTTNGLVWTEQLEQPGGDGGDVAVDDSDPSQTIRYFSSRNLLGFTRATYDNNNALLSSVNPTLIVAGTGGQDIYALDSLPFITSFELNRVDPTRMVFGGGVAVYESFDQGDNVTNLGAGGAGLFALRGAKMVYGGMLGGVPNPNVLWVGVGNSVLLRQTAGNPLAPTSYNGGAVRDIIADPDNWRTLYVIDSSGAVFRTTNAGTSFTLVTGNLTGFGGLTSDLRSIQYVPGPLADSIYVGSRDGVYRMVTTTPNVWARYGILLPNAIVADMDYDATDDLLSIGTFGRGAWSINASGASGDLTVDITGPTVFSEGAVNPATTARISRTGTVGNLLVTLTSSDTSEVTIQATAVIPDGASFVDVSINAVNDAIFDGTQTVVITASASGFNSISDVIDVTDNEQAALTVTVSAPKAILENAGANAITATVTRNNDTSQALVVQIYAADRSEISVPLLVTIPAGQQSVTFTIGAVDEFISDGTRIVSVVAVADGFRSGSDTLAVTAVGNVLKYDLLLGDRNTHRDQGQVLIYGNKISNSVGVNILVDSDGRSALLAGGGSGPVFIDGGDRDDFGHGQFNTQTGQNEDGWKFIEQALNFTYTGSRNTAGAGVLVIGANLGSQAADAIQSAVDVLALTIPGMAATYVNDDAISSANFTQFKVIYVPSNQANTSGGINNAELALLAARKTDIQSFVNTSGGGLLALTEAFATQPYSWLELPSPFVIDTNITGGALVQTPLLAAAGFTITDAEIQAGTPWHNSFIGPPGFNNLEVWVTSVTGEVVTLGLPAGSAGIGAVSTTRGFVRNLSTINSQRLVPGVTIENNLLVGAVDFNLVFSGDSNLPNGSALGAVPFGRIVNNTIYGAEQPTGIGVRVSENASPTLLNNIFANLATGIDIETSSVSTVTTGSLYQNNTTNKTGGLAETFAFSLAATDALFRDADTGNFYLAAGSLAIDSSIQQVAERSAMTSAKNLTGIPASNILAPDYDLLGQFRRDDITADPLGVGSSVFKDRGAIERVDAAGPTTTLLTPRDNDSRDQNPAVNAVHLLGATPSTFEIQLVDFLGAGIDDTTVLVTSFAVRRNGILLTPGLDYAFSYDTNNKVVRFISGAGIWLTGNEYTIAIDNGVRFDPLDSSRTPVGIRDLAGNLLQANAADGFTLYNIVLDSPQNDAPQISVSGVQPQVVNEDSSLTFSQANSNRITLFDVDAGSNPIQVTLTTAQGTLTVPAVSGVTVLGNGSNSITLTAPIGSITGTTGLNAALNGLVFTPQPNFNGPATINITANDQGFFPAPAKTSQAVVSINVLPVNDAPVNTVPPTQNISEDTLLTFSTTNGNAISVNDLDIPVVGVNPLQVTLTATNGTLTLGSIPAGLSFSVGDGAGDASMTFTGSLANINAALNGLVFTPSPNFNGMASVQISTSDLGNIGSGGVLSDTDTIQINVASVNDPPFLANGIPNVTVNEDDPPTVLDLSNVFSDVDLPGDSLVLSIQSNSNPALVNASLVGSTLTLTYLPNQNGVAFITIRVTDAGGAFVTTTFTVTVLPQPDAPSVMDDTYLFEVNTPLTVGAPGVLGNDSDVDGDPLTAVLFNVPSHGKLTLNSNGSFIYTPDRNFNGRDRFVYRADDGTGNRVSATVVLNSFDARWVERMYTEVLGRPSASAISDGEINFWVAQLAMGQSRQQVADFFVGSAERRGFIINQLYIDYIGRPVDPAGLNYWLGVWNANRGPERVQAGIIGSIEYFNTAGGTPQAWVTALYNNLLHRSASASEINFWASQGSSSQAREAVVMGFVTSDEYRLSEVINNIYVTYLHRSIDAAGANHWLQQLKSGFPQEAILSGILASSEYRLRTP